MKNFLTTSLLAMSMATPVVANMDCKQAGDYAFGIMEYRQEQMSLSTLMKGHEDKHARGELTKEGLAWTTGLILSAYEDYKAKYSDDGRLRITNEFRNKVELECYKEENK